MKDYYSNTRSCLDHFNYIQDKIKNQDIVTSEEDDEFLQNFCLYLAHALIKDTGYGQVSRDELGKTMDIVNDVIR